MVETSLEEHHCDNCDSETAHVRSKSDEWEFTACSECGNKLNDTGRRRTMRRNCEECRAKTKFVHYNTSITGVRKGFLQRKKKWCCSECGEKH